MSKETCQRCGEAGYDCRTLVDRTFFTLRVCKDCRAEWLSAIERWFDKEPLKEESCGSGLFVRRNGVSVEITREEFDRNRLEEEEFLHTGE